MFTQLNVSTNIKIDSCLKFISAKNIYFKFTINDQQDDVIYASELSMFIKTNIRNRKLLQVLCFSLV